MTLRYTTYDRVTFPLNQYSAASGCRGDMRLGGGPYCQGQIS